MRKVPVILLLVYFTTGLTTVSGQAPLQYRDTSNRGPQTFAIIMGVSNYKYIRPLTYADKDAELFRDYLKSPGGGSVKEENIFCLLNEQAINSVFWSKGFQWLKAKKLQMGDRLFIYLAGHGDAIDEDQFFFLSYDCNPGGDKNNYLAGGAIQLYNLKKKIAAETSRGVEVFFIMDACRTSELPGGNEGMNFLNTAVSQKKAGEIMMLATAAGQESLEDSSIGNGHGLFTWYLVDGLSGVADSISTADNKVTFQEIKRYVESNVPSVALQRFKRKQEPYFCCDENSEKVISTVNTAYLEKWLQTKRMQQRGPGNSFHGVINILKKETVADTTLPDTYNKFYQAIRNNNITGNESAEFFYQQLEKKFPANPYTLDARSSLTVEYINYAQALVNRYLDCGELTDKEKQQNNEAGDRLEKAINMIREDDEDFANSLSGRMYFLKASGAYPDAVTAFQFAYAALTVNPDAAYILNRLATLHLSNNRLDSAQFYAEKATRIAPKWICAATTLVLVKKAIENNKKSDSNKKPARRNSFGISIGGGITRSNPGYSGNTNTGFAGIDPASAGTFNLGLLFQAQLGTSVSIRPAVFLLFDKTSIDFQRRSGTGGPITTETVSIETNSIVASLPLIIRLGNRNTVPYLSLGPSFSYLLGQSNATAEIIPVKKSLFIADAGLGLDIGMPKAGIILSPEIKYSAGLSEWKDETVISPYTTALSSLKKQSFTLNIYLRKR